MNAIRVRFYEGLAVLMLLSLFLSRAAGGQYDVRWHRIAGGGGVSGGGAFGLNGTVGQAEAGPHTAAGFTIRAGYWNLMTLPRLIASGDDPVPVQAGRSIRIPVATLMANDRSLLGYGLTLVSVDASSARGGTLRIVGNWVVYQPPAGAAAGDSFHYTLSDGSPGAQHTATGTVRLDIVPPGEGPPPNAIRIAAAGPDFEITFIGVPDRSYRVQFTADAAPPYRWTAFDEGGMHTAPANGVFIHVDRDPVGPFRLYRAVAAPNP